MRNAFYTNTLTLLHLPNPFTFPLLYNKDIKVNLYKLHFPSSPFSFQPNKKNFPPYFPLLIFHPPYFHPNQTHPQGHGPNNTAGNIIPNNHSIVQQTPTLHTSKSSKANYKNLHNIEDTYQSITYNSHTRKLFQTQNSRACYTTTRCETQLKIDTKTIPRF